MISHIRQLVKERDQYLQVVFACILNFIIIHNKFTKEIHFPHLTPNFQFIFYNQIS